jgi:hypothetical protein
MLLVDEVQTVVASGTSLEFQGFWSSHPLVAMLARSSLGVDL